MCPHIACAFDRNQHIDELSKHLLRFIIAVVLEKY